MFTLAGRGRRRPVVSGQLRQRADFSHLALAVHQPARVVVRVGQRLGRRQHRRHAAVDRREHLVPLGGGLLRNPLRHARDRVLRRIRSRRLAVRPVTLDEFRQPGGVACYRVYRTADGRHLAVGALEFKFWKAFCDAVGLPELVQRHWAHGEAPGSDAAQDTIARVAQRIAQKTAAEWDQAFAPVDCCVTPVLTPAEALAHPHHHARGLVRRPGEVTEVGPLAQLSGHHWTPVPAPAQGEHTRAILAECGLDGGAIDALVQSGVVRER